MAESTKTAGARKRKRKSLKWLWQPLLIQLAINEFSGVTSAIAALLILLKAGILRLAQLPISAIIALLVIEVFLIAVVIVGTQAYMFASIVYGLIEGLSRLLKAPPPRQPWWLRAMGGPLLPLMAISSKLGVKLIEWNIKDEPEDEDET